MTVVLDASVVVSALVDDGPAGRWSEQWLLSGGAAAPHLMPVEAANILRRAALRGDIPADPATVAHGDLLDLPVELFPYDLVAARAWELRENLTLYDACSVALAEVLSADLVTLDERLARASGPRCGFRLYGR
jgi:predicted nucleic acid-binding protein